MIRSTLFNIINNTFSTANTLCKYPYVVRQCRKLSSTNYIVHTADCSTTLHINRPYTCINGGTFNTISINYTRIGTRGKPIVFIMPSMSHSSHVANDYTYHTSTSNGWWSHVVGYGHEYGINLDEYEVICAAALGAPYGTTSPLSYIDTSNTTLYQYKFPVITPADQCNIHAMLLDELNIKCVHSIIGASMGGMSVIQFAALHTTRYNQCIVIASTAQTSPSTVALRSTQRSAVMLDNKWMRGKYQYNNGPYNGMDLARKIGTIAYRSRTEFDNRFKWQPDKLNHRFDVENYLNHVSIKFSESYDANCYLVLSRCMDLMDIGYNSATYEDGCRQIPYNKQLMLLPIAEDSLIPSNELIRLGSVLGSQGKSVHCETLSSQYGHDAFLKESTTFNPRIAEFLSGGVSAVRQYVHNIYNH